MSDKPVGPKLVVSDTPEEQAAVPPPAPKDALDIESLWLDQTLGDGLTETAFHSVPIGKPRDFFRVIVDPTYRRRAEVYVHKPEGQIDTQYYILGPAMRGRLEEARPALIVTTVDREGCPRLWPLTYPKDGERDNLAWSTAREAARTALGKWVRLVWHKRAYITRDALPGYAPDPDVKRLPPFNKLIEAACGLHGLIVDTSHPIYRERMGAPPTDGSDDDDDGGDL